MHAFLKKVWALAKPYWQSEDKWRAYGLLLTLLVLGFAVVRIQVLTNELTRHFYDALQNYQPQAALGLALRYLGLVAGFALLTAFSAYVGNTLVNRWRRWLTTCYVDRWLDRQAFYRMPLYGKGVDNPDQRICDDIDQFTSITLSLFNGFYATMIQLLTFIVVLWHLSGVLRFSLASWHFGVPGYLVWCAFGYAAISTLITFYIGRRLSRLNYQQQHYTADFRFGLMRLREHAEAIAVMGGEKVKKATLHTSYQAIFDNFARLIVVGCNLTFFTKTIDYLSMMIGVLFALPKFMVEKMSVGDLMQISSAFGYVVNGFCFLMEAYTLIASWRAVVDRLSEFAEHIATTDQLAQANSVLQTHQETTLQWQHLALTTPQGQVLVKDFSHTIKTGEKVLITGTFGSGKSTLFRAIAGLWPFAEGVIYRPKGEYLFLSQKPYFPIGTLHAALSFPALPLEPASIAVVLEQLNLGCYLARLQESAHWMQVLSLGEQQMLSFARAILLKPQWLFLDEASSSLDEASEAFIYQQLSTLLPEATIISIGHRSSLVPLHDRVLAFASGNNHSFLV